MRLYLLRNIILIKLLLVLMLSRVSPFVFRSIRTSNRSRSRTISCAFSVKRILLDEKQRASELESLTGWRVMQNRDAIQKSFVFEDFVQVRSPRNVLRNSESILKASPKSTGKQSTKNWSNYKLLYWSMSAYYAACLRICLFPESPFNLLMRY